MLKLNWKWLCFFLIILVSLGENSVQAQIKSIKTQKKTKTIAHNKKSNKKILKRKKSYPVKKTVSKKKMSIAKTHPKPMPLPQTKPALQNINNFDTPFYALSEVEKRLVDYIRTLIKSMQFSQYGYGKDHMDTDKGVYIVDCSRYVDFIMKTLYPRAYETLVNWSQSNKPTSYDYYQYFNTLSHNSVNYWNAVEKVESLRPGDILVFRYKQKQYGVGGHVMIVMDTPKQEGDIFFVRIADSAPNAHSKDTRPRSKSGIGIGTLLIKVDSATSEPLAYAWSTRSKWNQHVNIAMGRPNLTL